MSALLTGHSLAPIIDAQILVARVQMGDIESAERALAQLDDDALESLAMRVVRATLELARDRPEAAAAALAPVVEDASALANDVRLGIQALLLEAIARDALRDAGGATRALERSLEFAEADGFVLPFLIFPAPELLERQTRLRTTHASLVAEILNLLSGRMPPARTSASEPLADALSDSELRVLRYLPTNLQAPEIAAELFVSVNTVRTHMRHIYAKLGVHRRAEAVERARELGLHR
jgi:LuxR family maltose regulon positive regulatory protein